MEVWVTGYNFESWPPKDHSCHVCFKLTYWFQRRRLLNFFSIESYVKTKSSHGGHLEFPIGKWFTSLVQDHPMIIPAKSQFNWLGGFWQEDFQGRGRGPSNEHLWQVWLKSVQRFQRRRVKCEKLTDDYPWQKLTWPIARWAKNENEVNVSYLWLIRPIYSQREMCRSIMEQN